MISYIFINDCVAPSNNNISVQRFLLFLMKLYSISTIDVLDEYALRTTAAVYFL